MGRKVKINNPSLIAISKETLCDLKSIEADLMKNSKESVTYNDVIGALIEFWREKR